VRVLTKCVFGSPESPWKALVSVPVVVIVILLVVIMVKCLSKKKSSRQVELKEITAWSGLYWFSKREIDNAMNYGGRKISLGRGSAGQVVCFYQKKIYIQEHLGC